MVRIYVVVVELFYDSCARAIQNWSREKIIETICLPFVLHVSIVRKVRRAFDVIPPHWRSAHDARCIRTDLRRAAGSIRSSTNITRASAQFREHQNPRLCAGNCGRKHASRQSIHLSASFFSSSIVCRTELHVSHCVLKCFPIHRFQLHLHFWPHLPPIASKGGMTLNSATTKTYVYLLSLSSST